MSVQRYSWCHHGRTDVTGLSVAAPQDLAVKFASQEAHSVEIETLIRW
jgi:hypothetical protein